MAAVTQPPLRRVIKKSHPKSQGMQIPARLSVRRKLNSEMSVSVLVKHLGGLPGWLVNHRKCRFRPELLGKLKTKQLLLEKAKDLHWTANGLQKNPQALVEPLWPLAESWSCWTNVLTWFRRQSMVKRRWFPVRDVVLVVHHSAARWLFDTLGDRIQAARLCCCDHQAMKTNPHRWWRLSEPQEATFRPRKMCSEYSPSEDSRVHL